MTIVKNPNIAIPSGFELPFIQSALNGLNGCVYADNEAKTFVIHSGIYCLITGAFTEEAALTAAKLINPKGFILTDDKNALNWFTGRYDKNAVITRRITTKYIGKPDSVYESIINALPSELSIRKIDLSLANQILNDWCKRLLVGYSSADEFMLKGVGYCITNGDTIVSGVTSLLSYPGGIEFQLMTSKQYENRRLAQIISARLLLHCVKNNLRPYWETSNGVSLHIAENLGFIENGGYDCVSLNFT